MHRQQGICSQNLKVRKVHNLCNILNKKLTYGILFELILSMFIRLILFLLLSHSLVACISLSTVNIQVLEPAPFAVTPDISSPALLNRNIFEVPAEITLNDSADGIFELNFYNQATTELIYSLAGILNESPATEFIDEYKILEMPGNDPTLVPLPLEPEYAGFICDSLDADALFSLEFLNFNYSDSVTLMPPAPGTYGYSYFIGEISIAILAVWRIYKSHPAGLTDEYFWYDTLKWQESVYNIEDFDHYLPSPEEAIHEASYYTALEFARRVSPFWLGEERYYFTRGNYRLRLAAGFMEKSQTANAELIYEELLNHRNKNTAAAAAFNMGFISELRGDYRKALNFARRSYQLKRRSVTGEYIEILEERLEKSNELDRQLGR